MKANPGVASPYVTLEANPGVASPYVTLETGIAQSYKLNVDWRFLPVMLHQQAQLRPSEICCSGRYVRSAADCSVMAACWPDYKPYRSSDRRESLL